LKRYADFQIQELSPLVDAAKVAMRQAEQDAKRTYVADSEKYFNLLGDRASYYSGSFYFGYLQSPIQSAETDADGKFVLNVPKQGSFVLAARAERYVSNDRIGHYYWLQPVSLNGQQQLTQNLSNNNLTSATGTSSLILTKD